MGDLRCYRGGTCERESFEAGIDFFSCFLCLAPQTSVSFECQDGSPQLGLEARGSGPGWKDGKGQNGPNADVAVRSTCQVRAVKAQTDGVSISQKLGEIRLKKPEALSHALRSAGPLPV